MSTLAERMDGDYRPPITAEPVGGPIPAPAPQRPRREGGRVEGSRDG